MNYRHAFHAGNFADVVKHAVLARLIAHLKAKPAPFRVIDTHAGPGLYDLSSAEARRTAEWRDGIGRLRAAPLTPPVADLLAPYLEAVAAFNPGDALATYPGSPALVRAWLRPDDRLVACELAPEAAAALAANFRRDRRVRTVAIDGYAALNAYVPPKERRGLVLIDPPFERPDEFARLAAALSGAQRKWPTGIYLAWYPLKEPRAAAAFGKRIRALAIPRTLRIELAVGGARERLTGAGLIVVNPPWTLESELGVLLPSLLAVLARDGTAGMRLDRLSGEK